MNSRRFCYRGFLLTIRRGRSGCTASVWDTMSNRTEWFYAETWIGAETLAKNRVDYFCNEESCEVLAKVKGLVVK